MSLLEALIFFPFLSMLSQKIIPSIPSIMPIRLILIFPSSKESGIKSKHIIEVIRPAANSKINPKNFEDFICNKEPIIPPCSCSQHAKKQTY